MCAPSRVGAIEPVGMTNASTTNARKMKARMKATRIDSSVSFTLPWSCLCRCAGLAATGADGLGGEDVAGVMLQLMVVEAPRRVKWRQWVVGEGSPPPHS